MEDQGNPHRGEVVLERPNGSPIGIRLDANAICIAERALGGRSISEITLEFAAGQVWATAVRALLWAGAHGYRAAHPSKGKAQPLSLEDMGRIIWDVGISEAANIAAEAIRLAFPGEEDTPESPDEPAEDQDEPGKAGATSSGEGS